MGKNIVSNEVVFQLLGQKWPEVKGYEGFCYNSVDHWIIEDNMLHPSDGFDHLVPGPSFEILKPVEDPLNPPKRKFYLGFGAVTIPYKHYNTIEQARDAARQLMIYDHRNIRRVEIYSGDIEHIETGREKNLVIRFTQA
jgi:hypothetical protein